MDNETGINKLITMQTQLMKEVPHELRPESFVKMAVSVKIIDTLLRYLNSTGHKPWRPIPLDQEIQDSLMAELKMNVGLLEHIHEHEAGADQDFSMLSNYSRQLVSAFGVIEETLEYLSSLVKGTDEEKLEEFTDVLFFYIELMVLGKHQWTGVEKEYVRKWHVNMERYRKAKEGDYSWDKRSKGGL